MLKKGTIDALFVVLIWSGFVLVSRLGGRSELLSYDVVALRFGTAAIFLTPYWLLRNNRKSLRSGLPAALAIARWSISDSCTRLPRMRAFCCPDCCLSRRPS